MYRAACSTDHAHSLLPGAQQNCKGTPEPGDIQKVPGKAVFETCPGSGGIPRDAPAAWSNLSGHHVQGVSALGRGRGGDEDVSASNTTRYNLSLQCLHGPNYS